MQTVYYRQENAGFRYLLEDASGYYIFERGDESTGQGGAGPSGPGKKKPKPAKPESGPGKPKSAQIQARADFDIARAPTAFDEAVAALEPPAPVVIVGLPPEPGVVDHARIAQALDDAGSALLAAHEAQQRIKQQAAQVVNARIAAQHAEWARKAKIIAIVNATLAT